MICDEVDAAHVITLNSTSSNFVTFVLFVADPSFVSSWQPRSLRLSLSGDGELQPVSELKRTGIFDVEHPPAPVGLDFGRRVNQERTHRDHAPGETDARRGLDVGIVRV